MSEKTLEEAQAYARGRSDERKAVVAWMRADADSCECSARRSTVDSADHAAAILRIAANTIERGEHLDEADDEVTVDHATDVADLERPERILAEAECLLRAAGVSRVAFSRRPGLNVTVEEFGTLSDLNFDRYPTRSEDTLAEAYAALLRAKEGV